MQMKTQLETNRNPAPADPHVLVHEIPETDLQGHEEMRELFLKTRTSLPRGVL